MMEFLMVTFFALICTKPCTSKPLMTWLAVENTLSPLTTFSLVPAGTPVFALPGLPPGRFVADGVAEREVLGFADGRIDDADVLGLPGSGRIPGEPLD